MDYEIALQARSTLGEGIWWDDIRQAYFWVDIMEKEIHRLKDGQDTIIKKLDDFTGFTIPTTDGRLMVGCGRKLYLLNPDSGEMEEKLEVDQDFDNNRFNDAKATPDGRIIAGTMNNALNTDDFAPNADTGGVYVIEKDKTPRKIMGGFKVPNGLAFHSDGKRVFYISDTFSQTIREYEYDRKTGDLIYKKDVIVVPEELGSPDGMTIAADNSLFVALWGGGAAARVNCDTGEIMELIKLPSVHVTCMAFGGPELDELLITTPACDAPEDEYPLAGSIFRVRPGVKGVKVDRYLV